MQNPIFFPTKFALFSVLISAASIHAAILVDFNTDSDFAANFRQTYNPAETITLQSGGIVSTTATGLNNGAVVSETFLYDTTPVDTSTKDTFSGSVTLSFDLRSTQTSSFGIYIVNPTETTGVAGHRLALFNLDNSGASDQLRIFSTASITSAVVGTAAYNSGAINVAGLGPQFVTASLAYSESLINPGHAVMNFTVNGVSTGDIDLGANTYYSSYEIGIRLFDANISAGSADIDNFSIVPEPSIAVLAALGLVFVGGLRRGYITRLR